MSVSDSAFAAALEAGALLLLTDLTEDSSDPLLQLNALELLEQVGGIRRNSPRSPTLHSLWGGVVHLFQSKSGCKGRTVSLEASLDQQGEVIRDAVCFRRNSYLRMLLKRSVDIRSVENVVCLLRSQSSYCTAVLY